MHPGMLSALISATFLTTLASAATFPDCGGFPASLQCKDVSPATTSFAVQTQQSVSGRMSAVVVAPSDDDRLYTSGFSGVWRSDDGGITWRQLTRPQPAAGLTNVWGSLRVPNVYDLAVSPSDKDVVLAATADETLVGRSSRQGIYRSTDGGESWFRVHGFTCALGGSPVGQIVFAPDDPDLAYAAEGCAIAVSTNGGATWRSTLLPAGGKAWHLAVAPDAGGGRRVYAAGDSQMWVSEDGGSSWSRDTSIPIPVSFGDYPAQAGGSAASILAVEPGAPDRVFLAVPALANGPSFYHPAAFGPDGTTYCNDGAKGCDEGSLWLGDYSTTPATWTKLPGPAVYFWVSTPSGNVYVTAKHTPRGYLLFFADRTEVYVSDGMPSDHSSWHRISGRDASKGHCELCFGNDDDGGKGCNQLAVHVDPHAFAVSQGLDFTLTAAACDGSTVPIPSPPPYDQNSILDAHIGGTMWMANDGGVYRSTDGGRTWTLGSGLSTLQPQGNFAGLAIAGRPPALYMGVPDNDNFFTLDGGESWRDPITGCGDCGPWFADPARPNRVLEIDRGPSWTIYTNPSAAMDYPDPANASHAKFNIPLPEGAIVADGAGFGTVLKGYRPVILTGISEDPPPDGDYIIIRQKTGLPRVILRTQAISSIASSADWETFATQAGPDFPPAMSTASVVQASGRHASPFYFVGDPARTRQLWRWTAGAPEWKRIVPATDGSAKIARRFFVDPYNPSRIYIVDENAIKRSEDAGKTWKVDASLDRLASEKKVHSYETYTPGERDLIGTGVLRDMVFDPLKRTTRFAVGDAGVFATFDGENWRRLLSTRAMPGHPVAAYYDRISDPANPMLYVAFNGRGIVRLGPLPAP